MCVCLRIRSSLESLHLMLVSLINSSVCLYVCMHLCGCLGCPVTCSEVPHRSPSKRCQHAEHLESQDSGLRYAL